MIPSTFIYLAPNYHFAFGLLGSVRGGNDGSFRSLLGHDVDIGAGEHACGRDGDPFAT